MSTMLIDQIILFVSAVIRNKNDKILFLKRSRKNKHYKYYWQLPEGNIKANESPSEAITRELKEEINYGVKNLDLRHILPIKIKKKGINFLLIKSVFVIKDQPQIRLSSDHLEYGWFSKEEAKKKLRLVPATKETLQKL